MFDLEPILEFSRNNCVAICSFLVPFNLISTIATLGLVVLNRSSRQISWSVIMASLGAIALFLHVSTWFMIGVITPVTFILLGLGTTCLTINAVALIYRQSILQWLATARSTSNSN